MSRPATLVTGASGFLGSHLVDHLFERGPVSATYHSSTPPEGADAVDWQRLDVLDADAVRKAVAGCDRVYHLAGVGLGSADAATVRRVNAEGTRNVVAACLDAAIDRLLFVSTAGTRRAAGVADETDVARPIGAYQESKAAAERIVDGAVTEGFDAVTVHPTSAFGPRDGEFTARLLTIASDPKLLAHPPGGASIVGVDDVVSGTVAAMNRGRSGEHYLLGGQNLTYREALDVIASVIDGHAPLITLPAPLIHALGPVAGAVNRRFDRRFFPFNASMARLATDTHFYSSRKARSELDYDPTPFRDVVPAAWDWFRREFRD